MRISYRNNNLPTSPSVGFLAPKGFPVRTVPSSRSKKHLSSSAGISTSVPFSMIAHLTLLAFNVECCLLSLLVGIVGIANGGTTGTGIYCYIRWVFALTPLADFSDNCFEKYLLYLGKIKKYAH